MLLRCSSFAHLMLVFLRVFVSCYRSRISMLLRLSIVNFGMPAIFLKSLNMLSAQISFSEFFSTLWVVIEKFI